MTEKNLLIELVYDDDLVSQAELLFESNAVSKVSIIDKNLYVSTVRDGKIYDIEIQFPFLKKQKVSCECTFYTQNNVCKHIVATLLVIRENEKLASQQVKKTSVKVKQKGVTLNVSQILDEISHEDLKAFVKQYAKEDKKLSTQLKVSFAKKIDLVDNSDKYKSLLNSIVRPYTGQATKVSAADIRHILHVLEDFAEQINDCIALGQFREAFNIYESAFAKLEYVSHYYDYQGENILKLSHVYHEILVSFLKEKLPPDLKMDLITYLMDVATRSYYHYHDVNINVLNILHQNDKKNDDEKSLEVIQELLKTRTSKEAIVLLSLYIKIKGKFTKQEVAFLEPYAFYMVDIADQLIANKEEILALKLLEYLQSKKKFEKDIVNRLVFLYVRTGDKINLKDCCTKAYANTGDVKYIDILKRELDEDAYAFTILTMEQRMIDAEVDSSIIIRLYKKEENWVGLLDYLSIIKDIPILQLNDLILYKHQREGLIELYKKIISSYIDDHLGDNAIWFLEDIKSHIKSQEMNGLLVSITSMLKDKYGHRNRLLEIFEGK